MKAVCERHQVAYEVGKGCADCTPTPEVKECVRYLQLDPESKIAWDKFADAFRGMSLMDALKNMARELDDDDEKYGDCFIPADDDLGEP